MQNAEAANHCITQSTEALDWPMARALRLALEIKDCRREIEAAFRLIAEKRLDDSAEQAGLRITVLIGRVCECGMAIDRIVGDKGRWRSWIYAWNARLSNSGLHMSD
jgi:hypothetical protein